MKPAEAEKHLRIIRSLMERATIYRAISAPSALVGGLLSIAACGFAICVATPHDRLNPFEFSSYFLVAWLIVFSLTVIANTLFIWQSAKKRQEPFLSSGMKMALFCSFPSFLSAFLFTVCFTGFFRVDNVFLSFFLPVIWIFFYGLALLSTSHFAPRSIIVLGWCFLLAGLLIPFFYLASFYQIESFPHLFKYNGSILMAATFGLFHLIYAACTWPRKASQPDEPAR